MSKFGTTGAGKGSAYRDVDKKKFAANWDAIFGKEQEEDPSETFYAEKGSSVGEFDDWEDESDTTNNT